MTSKIQIKEVNSLETLYEFSMDDMEKAYHKAQELEEMGLDIKLIIPSLTETLARTLGRTEDELLLLNEELNDEINDHEDSCTYCLPSDSKY